GREGGYLDVFFYNGPISRDMGFGDLLRSSYQFAERLQGAVHHGSPQLVSVATDGETFGHHKHFTEMTLAYAFTEEFPRRGWQVSNYAFYLHQHPPTWEVELKPVTAWSCSHGVDRWQADCGCGAPVGTGTWRKPLREALNGLRDRLGEIFEAVGPQHLRDIWGARDAYIAVVLAGLEDGAALARFWEVWGVSSDRATGLRLLEMQRHALLMFTSCGWFFEELSRPEGTQILRYAARAMELAAEITGESLVPAFVEQLALAPSKAYGNGAEVYRQLVVPHRVGPEQVVAQYAIDSLFRTAGDRVYGYAIARQAYRLQRLGALSLAMGRVTVSDALATTDFGFAVLHLGGYDVHCCVQPARELVDYEAIEQELFGVFAQASATALVLALSARFGPRFFTLQDLFAEERQRLLNLLTQETLTRLDRVYDQVYRDNYGILAAFRREKLPVPAELQVAAAVSLNQRLIAVLQQLDALTPLPLDELAAIATEGEFVGCTFPRPEAARILEEVIWQRLHGWIYSGEEPTAYPPQSLAQLLAIVERLGIAVDLRRVQELYFAYFDRRDVLRPPMPFWPELPLAIREAFLELGDRIGLDVGAALEPQ
ncbi:MAG: DUF3536 domain-containing protein, partial [Pseudanabaenaceae cyanobacterium]